MVLDDLSIAALTDDSIPASFGRIVGGIWRSSCEEQKKLPSSEVASSKREGKRYTHEELFERDVGILLGYSLAKGPLMHFASGRRLWRNHLRNEHFDVLLVPARRWVGKLRVQQRCHHHELGIGDPLGGGRKYALKHRGRKKRGCDREEREEWCGLKELNNETKS